MAKSDKSPLPYKTVRDQIDGALLGARQLFFTEDVNSDSTEVILRKLAYLDLVGPGEPILLIISSPGGSVDSGWAIWDQIQAIKSPVSTVVTGLAASMGTVLSMAAPKGRRFIMPNARYMIHQPLIGGHIPGAASDLEIHAKEILKTRERLIELYAENTGLSKDKLLKMMDRDKWMSAVEAVEGGFVDKVVNSYDEI